MAKHPYIGLTAYIPKPGKSKKKQVIPGIIRKHLEYQPPVGETPYQPESVVVETQSRNGKKTKTTHIIGTVNIVPKKAPKVWLDILEENKKVRGIRNVGVCLLTHTQPGATTLFNKKTGHTLAVNITTIESADIKLWDKASEPCQGKPEVDEAVTFYYVGDIELEMEASSY
jgi:hypothetical protein